MSFQKEDREKDNSSSGGLGVGLAAAAAIGVGIGAALYYFINKRTETPTAEGSTTRGWTSASTDTLIKTEDSLSNSDNSYITVSEHSTTDTSLFDDSLSCKCSENDSDSDTSGEEYSSWEMETNQSDTEDSRSTDETDSENDDSDVTIDSDSSDYHDSDLSEWDTTASIHSPSYEFPTTRDYLENYAQNLFKSRQKDKRNDSNSRRDEAFRERTWSLEECSICFEVILRDQEIMALPCTHNFHTKCILPWLQEQQTCPNCRKSVD